MAFIPIDRARPGMILAANVLDQRGRLLIPHGRELSDKYLGALRMWGVEGVEIEGEDLPEDEGPDVDEEVMGEARAEIDELFRNAGGAHPFLAFLKRTAVERHALALADKRVGAV